MDILIFGLWGLLTGAIICGGSVIKSNKSDEINLLDDDVNKADKISADVVPSLELTQDKLGEEFVFTNSVASSNDIKTQIEDNVSNETIQVDDAIFMNSIERKVVPELNLEESYSLPNGLSMDQIMLNNDGEPLFHIVQKGESLSQISQEYFGSFYFWPYIIDVNKHLFASPEKVQADMKIYLPNTTTYGINSKSTESIDKAKSLIGKYMH